MTQPDPEPAPPGLSTAHASDAQITAAVLAAVDAQRGAALELLDRLVTIPSVGGSEAECEIQHVVADVLHGEGFDVDLWALELDELRADPDFPGMEVERHEAYGVLATLPGHAPELGLSLLVDGHTDVVPPGDLDAWSGDPYELRQVTRDGRELLLGRGTCDMKAGLVAAIIAARAVRASGVRLAGDLMIAPVVGEEDGGLGTFALLRRGITADACLVPEPTDLDLVPANGGALTFRLHVPGRAVHASRRTEGVSAIDNLRPGARRAARARDAAQHRRAPAHGALADRLPDLARHRARRRLGLDRARPARRGGAPRRRARRDARAGARGAREPRSPR